MSRLIPKGKIIHQLYYWLLYFELEIALDEYIQDKKYQEKLRDIDKIYCFIKRYNDLPFYKRIYYHFFSPINEYIDIYDVYQAQEILNRLSFHSYLIKGDWESAVLELRSLDQKVRDRMPIFNFKYFLNRLKSWQTFPILPKNKDYLFNAVKYAFCDISDWDMNKQRHMDFNEREILDDINRISNYLHNKSINLIDNYSLSLQSHQENMFRFSSSINSYYISESWSSDSKSLRNSIINSVNRLLSNTIECVSSFVKCLNAFNFQPDILNTPVNNDTTPVTHVKQQIKNKLSAVEFEFLRDKIETQAELHESLLSPTKRL